MPEKPTFVSRVNRAVRALFAVGALLHLLLVGAQPFLAGWSLDGDGDALELHGVNGSVILTVSMVLIPLSLLRWRPGRGTAWAPVLTVLLFAAETFQLGMGYADIHIVHVPLGVGVVIGSFALVGLAFRRRPEPAAASQTAQRRKVAP